MKKSNIGWTAVRFLSLLLTVNQAQADIVCQAASPIGEPLKVVIQGNDETHGQHRNVIVSGAELEGSIAFQKASYVYDGREIVLITAPGLSIRYANTFGCIRNVQITTNLRNLKDIVGFIASVETAKCSGGSSPDEICY
jgi:hypothetical protein